MWSWEYVSPLTSYLAVQAMVKDLLADRERKPQEERERFLLIDFLQVDGIDVTGTMVFMVPTQLIPFLFLPYTHTLAHDVQEIAKSCRKAGLEVVMTGLSDKALSKFVLLPKFLEVAHLRRPNDDPNYP